MACLSQMDAGVLAEATIQVMRSVMDELYGVHHAGKGRAFVSSGAVLLPGDRPSPTAGATSRSKIPASIASNSTADTNSIVHMEPVAHVGSAAVTARGLKHAKDDDVPILDAVPPKRPKPARRGSTGSSVVSAGTLASGDASVASTRSKRRVGVGSDVKLNVDSASIKRQAVATVGTGTASAASKPVSTRSRRSIVADEPSDANDDEGGDYAVVTAKPLPAWVSLPVPPQSPRKSAVTGSPQRSARTTASPVKSQVHAAAPVPSASPSASAKRAVVSRAIVSQPTPSTTPTKTVTRAIRVTKSQPAAATSSPTKKTFQLSTLVDDSADSSDDDSDGDSADDFVNPISSPAFRLNKTGRVASLAAVASASPGVGSAGKVVKKTYGRK